MTTFRQTVLSKAPKKLVNIYTKFKLTVLDGYAHKSYSQEGEDMILRRIFENQTDGFFVDVGAHHPKRFSNTYYFYKRGWRGINIDATPGSMREFKEQRSEDINIEVGIAEGKETLNYYMFNDPALNTFDGELALQRENIEQYFITSRVSVSVTPLQNVLKKYLPVGQIIDFMTIDVEGFDLPVLHSNDWEYYRPRYLLVECLEIENWGNSDPMYNFLKMQNYVPIAKTLRTMIYKDATINA